MKKTLYTLLSFFLLVSTALGQTTYPGGITGCIARWDFANSGNPITSLPDVSGNSNNGTVANITTAPGFRNVANKAMLFNGASSVASVAHNSMLQPTQMTMVCVVKINGFYTNTCQGNHIVGKGNDHTSGFYGLSFSDQVYNNCNTFSANHQQLTPEFDNINAGLTPGNYLQTSKWYFFAASFDGTTHKYYQVEMDPNNYISNLAPYFTANAPGAIGSNSANVLIGRHVNTLYPYWFDGSMEEIALFNRVLTNAEMQQVYDYLWGIVAVTSVSSLNLCTGSNFTVNYSVNNTSFFSSANTFTVQLSDASGSFASPVSVGSTTASGGGSISCTIPAGTSPGTGYRVRIVANNVPYTTADNGTNITVNTGGPTVTPVATAYISPGDTICAGDMVAFHTLVQNAGLSPQYQWIKNGVPVPGATSATYYSNMLTTGDAIYCQVTAGGCATSSAVNSNGFTMAVLPKEAVSVNVTANPGTLLSPWQLVTFTANVSNGGTNPAYQWKKNGIDVVGATSNTWSANNLQNNDQVSVEVISNALCAEPKKATSELLTISIKTGVEDIEDAAGVSLYPNPNAGVFTISGNCGDKAVLVEVMNMLGQVVYNKSVTPVNGIIHKEISVDNLPNGIYQLSVKGNYRHSLTKFTISK